MLDITPPAIRGIDLAANQVSPTRQTTFGIGWLSWAAYHLLSLETLLVLFLHGRHLKIIMPSPPVPETLFYGALSVAVASWIILREGLYLRGIPIVVAGLAFTGWAIVSYGWTAETALAREQMIYILGINLWALFVAACVVAASRERVLRFLLLLVLVTAILAFIGAYIELVHGSFRFYRGSSPLWEEGRVYLYWGNIVATGAAIVMAIVIHSRFGQPKQLIAAAILGVSFYFVMVSGARGATLGILAAAFLALLINKPEIQDGRIAIAKTQLVVFALIALLMGYVTYLLTTGQTTSTLGRFLNLFDQAEDPLLRRGVNRFDYFAAAYRAWLEAPIFGQGLYGFSYYFCGPGAYGCYPHNAILQILADFGLVGLVFFLAFLFSGMRHLGFARLRRDPLMFTLAMAFATVIINVMVANDTMINYRLFLFIGLLAMRPPPPEADDDDEDAISQTAEDVAAVAAP